MGVALRDQGSIGWTCTGGAVFGLAALLLVWLSSGVSLLDDDWGHLRLCEEGLRSLLTTGWTGLAGAGGYYRPVVALTFYGTFLLAEYNPLPHHVVNVLVHCFCGILVYLLALRLLKGAFAAWSALFLFFLLPVHVDTVYWIVGRTDSVCALFYLSALLLFLAYRERPSPGLLAGAGLCAMLAFFSKEMALSLPAVLLILFCHEGSVRSAMARRALLCSITAMIIYLCARWMVLGGILSGIPDRNLTLPGLGLDVLKSGAKMGMTDVRFFGVVLSAATAVVFWLSGRPRRVLRDTLYLGGLTLVGLAPVLGRVHRWYLYLPSVFFCIAVANVWAAWQPDRKAVLRCRNLLLAALVGYYGLALAREGWFWREASVLSENVLKTLAPLAKENRGTLYVLNVPSALSPPGSLGEIPLYAFGLTNALAVRTGVETPVVAVNHCWLTDPAGFETGVTRLGPAHWRIEVRNGGYFSAHGQADAGSLYGPDGKLRPGVIRKPWGESRFHGPGTAEFVLETGPHDRVAIFDRGGVGGLQLRNETR
ncbi:MAG: glycosyltransferase family 39 protein [Gemmatimonadota bacterium]|nr:glycosyltransferase family 39 protein [Gemmatimonadota bacterium]